MSTHVQRSDTGPTQFHWDTAGLSTQSQRSPAKRPLITRLPSIWLRIVSWSFKIVGFMTLPFVAIAVVALVIGEPPYPPLYLAWWQGVVILATSSALHLRIGFLLAKRSREGAVTLLLLALYPFPLALLTKQPVRWEELVFIAVELALVASIWPQLSKGDQPVRST
jgi:hypothetical protein